MRITIVTGPLYPVPPAPCGAVERIWHGLGEEFARRGHQVTVLCRGHETQTDDETVGGVRYVRRTRFSRSESIAADLAKDMAYSLRMLPLLPAADVTVTNVFWLPAILGVWRRRAGRIVINVARSPKRQMRLYSRVDRLAAVSTAIRQQIFDEYPALDPLVKVLPNPIDTGTFVPPAAPRANGGGRVLLYTGRIHPEKGVHLLVAAFAKVHAAAPDLRLRVIGPQTVEAGGGGEPYLSELREQAKGLPVEFCPPLYGRHELAAALQSAHYYCYPSLAEKGESFGVAPLEAMATGLVPVVSDLSCFRDFITDGRTGLIFDHRCADPAAALASALSKVIDDPGASARIGRAAVEKAAEYGYPQVADLYLNDFEQLLAGGGGGAYAVRSTG